MHFNQELKCQRESMRLTQEQAADKARLSKMDYEERESTLAEISFAEKVGLLVVLGKDVQEAMKIAEQPEIYSMGELSEDYLKSIENPYVKETKDHFILINRRHDGYEYEIRKEEIKSPIDILSWVDHLTEKVWITTEHISQFIGHASQFLKINIHGS